MKYGKWTPTGEVSRRKSGKQFFNTLECVCDCGTKKFVWEYLLKKGESTQCKSCANEQQRGRPKNTRKPKAAPKQAAPKPPAELRESVPDKRTGKWYVRMVGSAHTLPQWAAGPPEAPCWTGGEKCQQVGKEMRDVPAEDAVQFDTKAEARHWIEDRVEYLTSHDRFPGNYAAVKF